MPVSTSFFLLRVLFFMSKTCFSLALRGSRLRRPPCRSSVFLGLLTASLCHHSLCGEILPPGRRNLLQLALWGKAEESSCYWKGTGTWKKPCPPPPCDVSAQPIGTCYVNPCWPVSSPSSGDSQGHAPVQNTYLLSLLGGSIYLYVVVLQRWQGPPRSKLVTALPLRVSTGFRQEEVATRRAGLML